MIVWKNKEFSVKFIFRDFMKDGNAILLCLDCANTDKYFNTRNFRDVICGIIIPTLKLILNFVRY